MFARTFIRCCSFFETHDLLIGRAAGSSSSITAGRGVDWIQSQTSDILNTCRQGRDFRQETGAHFHAQAHISTQPASPLENAWLPLADEDQIGSSRAEPSACGGPQARFRQRWISRLVIPAVFSAGAAGTARFFRPESLPISHERTVQV